MDFEIVRITKLVDQQIDYDKLIFKARAADVLDLDNSHDLWLFVHTLIAGGARKLILDMEGLDFIDSSGIGVLIKIAKLIRTHKGDIVLVRVAPHIDTIFKPVELRRFIKMFDTEEEATGYLKMV